MQQLIKQIEQWAEERNLIKGSTPQKQMLKLMEEFGELCSGITKNKPEVIKDSIGDCGVVLIIINKQLNILKNFEANEGCWGGPIEDALQSFIRSISSFQFDRNWFNDLSMEIRFEIMEENVNRFKNAIGYLDYIAMRHNLEFFDCLKYAYNQIKDRKGKMIDGVFVKEEDL